MKKYKTLLIVSATLFALLPAPVLSAGILSAKETVAGIGASVTLNGFEANAPLTLTVVPPLGADFSIPAVTDGQGNAEVRINGSDVQVAGSYALSLGTQRTTLSVSPDTIDVSRSSIETDRSAVLPDGEDEVRVTVILRDRYLNPLVGRPVELVAGRAEDRISADGAETDEEGQIAFRISTTRSGTISLRAMDLLSGKLLIDQAMVDAGGDGWAQGGYSPSVPLYSYGTQNNSWNMTSGGNIPLGEFRGRTLYGQVAPVDLNVNAGTGIDHFRIQIDGQSDAMTTTPTVPRKQDLSFRVFAEDASGRLVEDYTGSVRFSSTDAKAILPFGTRQFTLQDLGVKSFVLGLRFDTTGDQTVVVEDATGRIKGQLSVNVRGTSEPTKYDIMVTDPPDGSTVNTPTVVMKGRGPALVNLLVTGGKEIVRGETDSSGNFQIIVALLTSSSGATLRVEEAAGKYFSKEINLVVDVFPPKITSIEFDPSQPMEGQMVKVRVKSEPNAPSATVTINTTQSPLIEDPLKPGTYEGSFMAPEAGTFQPAITIYDKPGNKAELLSNLVIKGKTPPKVEHVIAEPKANGVMLKWDALPAGEADMYRIYVGEDPENFAYSLDTKQLASSATVAGLNSATTYSFAVTALKGDVESVEKSDVVQATVLGLKLSVTPGDQSLMLTWPSVGKETPLSSFVLEYGVEPEKYTEKRMINGDARSYVLRDLINGVSYFLKLTPATVTGELLKDLAATGEGRPNGQGFGSGTTFHGGAPEEITPFPPPPPERVPVGPDFSSFIWWLSAAGACALLLAHWYRRRTLKLTAAFLQHMDHRYRA